MKIIDGLTSLDNYAQAIFGHSPAAEAAHLAYGSVMVAQYMSINSAVAAISSAPGNNIYINASWINGMTLGQQQGLLLHELLHVIIGQGVDVIQCRLGLPTGVPSQNIGDKLERDCF